MSQAEPVLEDGWIDAALAAEFPDLRLRSVTLDVPGGSSTPGVRMRLEHLSNRFGGPQAIVQRRQPVPQAYRVFFRTIGLDPDASRTPVEGATINRLIDGRYTPQHRLSDAQLLALVETGVPLWALDEARLDGPLGIREARAGERLGEGPYANELPAGRFVVADAHGPVGVLFGEAAPGYGAGRNTPRVRLYTVQVSGVPEIHVSEALWLCAEALLDG